MRFHSGLLLPCVFCGWAAVAQQGTPARPVASVATEGVTLRGAMSVESGRAAIANNGEITAGEKAATVALQRGGTVEVCASTTVHLSRDATARTAANASDAGLMFSLDRGAMEARYTPGAYSDVVLTPDLRLLVSGPGQADLKLRVNGQGDTCVDNAGENAPYVTASSLMDGGAYRVRPGQRVLFVHGSLNEVVDNEREPCGCPPAAPPTEFAGKTGGPSSTPADTAFPTAVSEGLQPPPQLGGSAPVVPNGAAHAQVSATLASNAPLGPPPAPAPSPVAAAPVPAAAPGVKAPPRRGFFGGIGHFFARVFGAS